MIGRGHHRHEATHRVPDEGHTAARNVGDEASRQLTLGAHGGSPAGKRRQAESDKVKCEQSVVRREEGGDRFPVEMRAAESVEEDDSRAIATMVYVVDRPVHVDDVSCPGHRSAGCHTRGPAQDASWSRTVLR